MFKIKLTRFHAFWKQYLSRSQRFSLIVVIFLVLILPLIVLAVFMETRFNPKANPADRQQLKYFGYYRFLDFGFNQVSDHATTAIVPTVGQITKAAESNLNSIYIASRFFWESDPNHPGKLILKNNWRNGWDYRLNEL
ncbi:MAG: hypothetical protein U0946_06275, partial [Patescibacteria group bacterium]|nr:hypothetical protein [Patescibacteria group bacterium]